MNRVEMKLPEKTKKLAFEFWLEIQIILKINILRDYLKGQSPWIRSNRRDDCCKDWV